MAKKAAFAFLTLALLLGVVVTYYFIYISERESYVIERNFRLLALWSDELSHVVDDYKKHLEYITSATAGKMNQPNAESQVHNKRAIRPHVGKRVHRKTQTKNVMTPKAPERSLNVNLKN